MLRPGRNLAFDSANYTRRSVARRNFARLGRHRHLSKDYERSHLAMEALI
jgi:hypothetical protein